jgi:hypothetical protein
MRQHRGAETAISGSSRTAVAIGRSPRQGFFAERLNLTSASLARAAAAASSGPVSPDGAKGAPSVFDSKDVEQGPTAPVAAMTLESSQVLDGGAVWLRYQIKNR